MMNLKRQDKDVQRKKGGKQIMPGKLCTDMNDHAVDLTVLIELLLLKNRKWKKTYKRHTRWSKAIMRLIKLLLKPLNVMLLSSKLEISTIVDKWTELET